MSPHEKRAAVLRAAVFPDADEDAPFEDLSPAVRDQWIERWERLMALLTETSYGEFEDVDDDGTPVRARGETEAEFSLRMARHHRETRRARLRDVSAIDAMDKATAVWSDVARRRA